MYECTTNKSAMNKSLISETDIADLLVSQSPDAIIFADLSGIIGVWNVAAERIFGFTANAAIGAKLDIIFLESKNIHRNIHRGQV